MTRRVPAGTAEINLSAGTRSLGMTALALALAAGQVLAQAQPAPAAAAASQPAASQPSAARPAQQPNVLQEVVVTAQKVAQPASKTPVALTVLGGEDLKDAGIDEARALTEAVPNVNIAQESGRLTIAIRGVFTIDTSEWGDPSAAFHVDGVYVARPEAQTGTFLDLERIEVLRGPQGTLYGRNATSGAINLISNKPTRRLEGRVEAGFGNYGAKRVESVINVPLDETFALRAAVSANRRDTYLIAGPNTDTPLESRDDYAGRVHLLANFSRETSLLLSAETSHQGGGGATPVPIGNFFTGTYIGRLPFSPPNTGNNIQDPMYVDRGSEAQRTTGLPFHNPDAHRSNDHSAFRAEFKTRLGFADLTYQFAYAKSAIDEVWNGVNFGFPFRGDVKGPSDSTSHELRLNSVGESPLRWVAGAYLFDEKIHRDTVYTTSITAPFGAFKVIVPFNVDVKNKSRALFGQTTYALVPETRLTLGLRRTHDEKLGTDTLAGTPAVPPATSSPNAFSKAVSFDDTSWRVGVDHDLARGTMLYASAATGYKAGGFNGDPSAGAYRPEQLLAFEVGVKSRLLADRLQLSANVFHYDYEDMQLTSLVCRSPNDCAVVTTGVPAKIQGVELEGRWLVGDHGEWRAWLALNKTRFGSYQPNQTTDWSGQPLDRAPKAGANLAYSHHFNLGSGAGITATIGQQLSAGYYISDPASGVRYYQPSFHKSNASLAWTDATGKVNVQLFVKNIEDKVTIESRVPGSFFIGDPRTYGVRASCAF